MKILGLDEAGRGSVLGPMTIGAYLVDAAALDALAATGVTDSKKLSAKRRVALHEPLRALGIPHVLSISAEAIDAGNLNKLEEQAFLALIAKARPGRVIIDAPCHPRGIPAFERRLAAGLADRGCPCPELVVEPKADLNYRPVGAASVFAKVQRDDAIKELNEESSAAGHGPVGSGYPSDPVTRAWLMRFLKEGRPFPLGVRTRWGTLDVLRDQLAQSTIF